MHVSDSNPRINRQLSDAPGHRLPEGGFKERTKEREDKTVVTQRKRGYDNRGEKMRKSVLMNAR